MNFPLVTNVQSALQDAWTGVTSPQGRAALWSAAGVTAQVGASAAAPVVGLPASTGGLVAASATEVARRSIGQIKEMAYWNHLKTPLLLGGIAALFGAAKTRSKFLGVIGIAALGGYVYGRSRYEP